MGQKHSTQPDALEQHRHHSTLSNDLDADTVGSPVVGHSSTPSQVRRKLKHVELHSVRQLFDELKSTDPSILTCIEAQRFLDHLQLPTALEPAGILLFKSFSYLGSYPDSAIVGPVPLTLDAFVTAFAVLTGKMDQEGSMSVFEECLFESLAILPAPIQRTLPSLPPDTTSSQVTDSKVLKEEKRKHKRGLSLAELGVSFDDIDFDSGAKECLQEEEKSMNILCRDLTDLVTLLLWIEEHYQVASRAKTSENTPVVIRHSLAASLVASIQPTSNIGDLPSISKRQFDHWKQRHAPRLFGGLRTFLYNKFAVTPLASHSNSFDVSFLGSHHTPVPDESSIFHGAYITLLSWRLPEPLLLVKQWPRLYSANQDGFAMNRFEKHVFKYPGPTLLLIQAELMPSSRFNTSTDTTSRTSQPKVMTLGAFIPEPWKHTKQYWGSDDCFLFELSPSFEICGSTRRNMQYIYCHTEFGIGFGGTSDRNQPPKLKAEDFAFSLTLDNTLQTGTYGQEAYPTRPTFEKSLQNPSEFLYTFDTVNIEVFGLGSEQDRQRQQNEWSFEEHEAIKRSGLQIRQQDGHVDKEILRMAGIIDDQQ